MSDSLQMSILRKLSVRDLNGYGVAGSCSIPPQVNCSPRRVRSTPRCNIRHGPSLDLGDPEGELVL